MRKIGRRKILHIQKVAGIAGSENHLLTLVPKLCEYGYEPTFLALTDKHDNPTSFVERMRKTGVSCEVMSMIGDADPVLLLRMMRFFKQASYDLVHTHLLHADLYGRVAGRIVGTKMISTYHCDDPFHLIPVVKQLDQLTARCCSQIICISQSVKSFLETKMGMPRDRLTVVRYGLDPNYSQSRSETLRRTLGFGSKEVLVGIVARLTAQKGHVYLLQAMKDVIALIPTCYLIVIGDGEDRQKLESLTFQLGIERHVRFLGFRPDASDLMKDLDLVVVPSLFEGFGLVLLEAMAASKPIVASRVSAIPELIVDGETGVLVPPRDSLALSREIQKIVLDPSLANRLGQRGRERLQALFSVQKMVERTVQVYEKVFSS